MLLVDFMSNRQSLAPQNRSCSSGMASGVWEAKRQCENTGDLEAMGCEARGAGDGVWACPRRGLTTAQQDAGLLDQVSPQTFPLRHVSVYLILRCALDTCTISCGYLSYYFPDITEKFSTF